MNEKFIGIIAAEDKEISAIKNKMINVEEEKIYNLTFYKGKINSTRYVLVKSGVGKVNSARTAQILIDKFAIEGVINIGSAGGINESLEIGDIVIGKKLVQHDFDVTAFGREKGFIPDTGKVFESDKTLIENIKNSLNTINEDFNIHIGTIATGDTFITDIESKDRIRLELNADCVEMEGAAIAQTCMLCNIPFVVIRGISDVPNGNNQLDFDTYLEMISKRVADVLEKLIV